MANCFCTAHSPATGAHVGPDRSRDGHAWLMRKERMDKAIRARLIIDGTGAKPLKDGVLFIKEGRVDRICSTREVGDSLGPDVQLFDCSDKTVIPGLIDAHVHLTFSGGKDSAETRYVLGREENERLAIRALSNAQQALRAGVTTVRDCGGRGLVTLRVRDAINSGLAMGPQIVTSGMPVTTTAGHLHWCGLQADSIAELRKATRRLVQSGVDFVKVMGTGGFMTPGSNPRMPQYSAGELGAVVEEAHRLGRHVAMHVHATEGIRRAIDAGADTLEHCSWLGMEEGGDYDPSVVPRIIEKGIYVDLQRAISERVIKDKSALARQYAVNAPWRDMVKQGVKLILGTDAGVSDACPFDSLPSVVASAVYLFDLNPIDALAACTRVPAEAFGLETEIGTLEPGKRANLVVLEDDPLNNILNLKRVNSVYLDGEEVLR